MVNIFLLNLFRVLHSESPQSLPPNILFDAIYPGLVVLHFSTETTTREWKDTYSDGVMTRRRAAHGATTMRKTWKQVLDHDPHHERRLRHRVTDSVDMVMAVPCCLVPPDEQQYMMRATREATEAAEQRRVQGKVEGWIRQVNAA
ncbi:hypothetical protein EDB83DRAFT_1433822 [Lactarius deliciosus]|nr:hypothetical protein EDB83DRAFT_1433822 [Lactarius deliciosus]